MNSIRIQTNEHPRNARAVRPVSCTASPDLCTHVQDMQACADECKRVCTSKMELLKIIERCLKFYCFRMEESKNLLAALEKMLEMKTAEPSTSPNPTPSTSGQSTSTQKRLHESDPLNPTKKPRLDKTVRQSVGNTFSTIDIPVGTSRDLTVFLEQAKGDICEKIEDELCARNALKFYLIVRTQLYRTTSDGDEQIANPYICSVPKILLQSTDIGGEIDVAGERIKELLATHEGQGSGFKLDLILECQLQIATYDRIGESSYIPLPKYIQSKKATINIKNVSDEKFFQYSVLYAKLQPTDHPYRPTQYKKNISLNWTCQK